VPQGSRRARFPAGIMVVVVQSVLLLIAIPAGGLILYPLAFVTFMLTVLAMLVVSVVLTRRRSLLVLGVPPATLLLMITIVWLASLLGLAGA